MKLSENASQTNSEPGPRAVLFVDEGGSHLRPALDDQRHLGPISELKFVCRGGRVVMYSCSHSPSIQSAPSLLASIIFCGCIKNGACKDIIQSLCGLTDEQTTALSYLPVNICLCLLRTEDGYRPLLLNVPYLHRPVLSMVAKEAHNKEVWSRLGLPEVAQEISTPSAVVKDSESTNSDDLSSALIRHIHQMPWLGVAEHADSFLYKGRKLATKDLEKALSRIEADGLCVKVEVRRSQRGSATHYYVPTAKGYDAIGNPSDQMIPSGGSGTPHAFKCCLLDHDLNLMPGVTAQVESAKHKKIVDVLVQHEGRIGACEIVHSTTSNEPEQAMKNLADGNDFSVHVFDNKTERIKGEKRFRSQLGDDIDPRITLVEWWHIIKCQDIRQIYSCRELMYKPQQSRR